MYADLHSGVPERVLPEAQPHSGDPTDEQLEEAKNEIREVMLRKRSMVDSFDAALIAQRVVSIPDTEQDARDESEVENAVVDIAHILTYERPDTDTIKAVIRHIYRLGLERIPNLIAKFIDLEKNIDDDTRDITLRSALRKKKRRTSPARGQAGSGNDVRTPE